MKYCITRKCGCEEMVELFGKGDHREYRLNRMKETICDCCHAKKLLDDENNTVIEVHYGIYVDYYKAHNFGYGYNADTKKIKVVINKNEVEEMDFIVRASKAMLKDDTLKEVGETTSKHIAKRLYSEKEFVKEMTNYCREHNCGAELIDICEGNR